MVDRADAVRLAHHHKHRDPAHVGSPVEETNAGNPRRSGYVPGMGMSGTCGPESPLPSIGLAVRPRVNSAARRLRRFGLRPHC
jgi:hypothetical protein